MTNTEQCWKDIVAVLDKHGCTLHHQRNSEAILVIQDKTREYKVAVPSMRDHSMTTLTKEAVAKVLKS